MLKVVFEGILVVLEGMLVVLEGILEMVQKVIVMIYVLFYQMVRFLLHFLFRANEQEDSLL